MTVHHVTLEFVASDLPPPRVEHVTNVTVPAGARVEDHLAQWVAISPERVEAHYVFDEAYARAHPESLDPEHLVLLHGIITMKLFDEGEVILPPWQVERSVRWPTFRRAPRTLTG